MLRALIGLLMWLVLPGLTPRCTGQEIQDQTGRGDRYAPPGFASRSATIAPEVMAATSHPLATQVALDILREGGTAVDAAIAANAAIGFLEPMSNGIGGDLFAIVWSAEDGRLYGLNASGRAPQRVTLERVLDEIGDGTVIPTHSPFAVTVPGAVDGWFELHGRFGRLPMNRVLAPAIAYARDGAPVPHFIADQWKLAEGSSYQDMPGFAATFLPEGGAPDKGDVFRNAALSRTLEAIASGGRAAFYEGALARELVAFCETSGCHIGADDLAAHRSTWVDPVGVEFRGFTLWELPPNGQGIAALQMLQLLQPFDLASMGHNSAAYLHHLIEAKKIAYEDRGRYYADPEFATIPVSELISESYAQDRRRLIDPTRANERIDPGDPRAGRGGTIYLAVGDSAGNMVSLIQSNYSGFGSGFVPPTLGFVLQNRGCGFSLEAGHPNVIAPGKRPFHTIIPAFVTREGDPYMAFGVMGGDVQPQGQIQVLLNHIVFGMDLQEAGDAARFRHSHSTEPGGKRQVMTDGGCVSVESGIGEEVRVALSARGHRLCQDGWIHYGGYQAVRWDDAEGVYWGATESRVDGQAAGW